MARRSRYGPGRVRQAGARRGDQSPISSVTYGRAQFRTRERTQEDGGEAELGAPTIGDTRVSRGPFAGSTATRTVCERHRSSEEENGRVAARRSQVLRSSTRTSSGQSQPTSNIPPPSTVRRWGHAGHAGDIELGRRLDSSAA